MRPKYYSVIETRKYVYITELKVNSSADVAIKQIQDKGNAEKYKAVEYQDKTVILLGINFENHYSISIVMVHR